MHFVLIVQTPTHLRMIITVKFTNDFNVIWEKHGFTKFLIKNKTIQINWINQKHDLRRCNARFENTTFGGEGARLRLQRSDGD